MTSGISIRSAAMAFKRAFNSARSAEPGAYERLGSLIGSGTRRTPANAASRTGAEAGESPPIFSEVNGWGDAVVDIVKPLLSIGRAGRRAAPW
jgi:hypothetical protein